jgi:hypothetical protein
MRQANSLLSPEKEEQIKAVFHTLSEKDKRRYVASLSLTLPHGGCEYLSQLLGCSHSTITRGRSELDRLGKHGDPAAGRVRSKGAGRPKKKMLTRRCWRN